MQVKNEAPGAVSGGVDWSLQNQGIIGVEQRAGLESRGMGGLRASSWGWEMDWAAWGGESETES